MPHFPKPFFKKGRRLWYVEIDRTQVNLGPDRDEAFRRYYQLMTQPRATQVATDCVLRVIDAFLEWCSKNRSGATYRWYRDRLQEFAKTIDAALTVSQLRPFHVQQWIDARGGWSDGSRRNGIRAVKQVFRWAAEQGYIDRSPVAHMKQPQGGKREVVVSQAEFDEVLSLAKDEGFRDLLIVTWETGCRPQESLIVEARHVDLANQRWVFQPSEEKCGRSLRVVYLTDRALAIVKRLMIATRWDRSFAIRKAVRGMRVARTAPFPASGFGSAGDCLHGRWRRRTGGGRWLASMSPGSQNWCGPWREGCGTESR